MKIVMAIAANVPGLKKEQTNLVRKCEKGGLRKKNYKAVLWLLLGFGTFEKLQHGGGRIRVDCVFAIVGT